MTRATDKLFRRSILVLALPGTHFCLAALAPNTRWDAYSRQFRYVLRKFGARTELAAGELCCSARRQAGAAAGLGADREVFTFRWTARAPRKRGGATWPSLRTTWRLWGQTVSKDDGFGWRNHAAREDLARTARKQQTIVHCAMATSPSCRPHRPLPQLLVQAVQTAPFMQ